MYSDSHETTCCVVGGGPAGVMLGYLLARAGVATTVLEKHADFLRDFRGDTIHPSTLQLMDELELSKDLLRIPHQKITAVRAQFGEETIEIADLSSLKARFPYIAMMPQWDFLNFLAGRARDYSTFDLRMNHEAIDLLRDDGRIQGVVARTPDGITRVRANLVIACDGRHSAMRDAANLPLKKTGVPIDVLWFRIGRDRDDYEQLMGKINFGKALVLFNRGDYYQAGLIVPKGSADQIRQQGLEEFRALISRIAPNMAPHVNELDDWDKIKLLSVQINRLERWSRPGLLCIGDAAHAMSPAFGVGINLAIQDAVAAANLLATALRHGRNTDALLEDVQRRRQFPARVIQLMQVIAHTGLEYVFRHPGPMRAPRPLKIAMSVPLVRKTLAHMVGIGPRPEQVQTGRRARRLRPVRQIAALVAGVAAAVSVAWRGFRTI